jgi:hypothetical protein
VLLLPAMGMPLLVLLLDWAKGRVRVSEKGRLELHWQKGWCWS